MIQHYRGAGVNNYVVTPIALRLWGIALLTKYASFICAATASVVEKIPNDITTFGFKRSNSSQTNLLANLKSLKVIS